MILKELKEKEERFSFNLYFINISESETSKIISLIHKDFPIPSSFKRIKKKDGKMSCLLKVEEKSIFQTETISLYGNNYKIEHLEINDIKMSSLRKYWSTTIQRKKNKKIKKSEYKSEIKILLKKQEKGEECANYAIFRDKNRKYKFSGENKHILNHVVHRSIKKISKNSEKNYLCTGFDVFLSKEPCNSCCMSLLHARVGRVFFIDSENKKKSGKRGFSDLKIHRNKMTNHRFSVFKFLNEKKI